jgi:hypothetical protein
MPKLPLPLPDEQPVAVNALRNKRSAIAGMIEVHQREIDRLRGDLVHLDAALRLFDPGTDPNDILPHRRFPRRSHYFATGEQTRRVFEAIRDHGTVSATELALKAMTDFGISETDAKIRREFVSRFMNTLHAQVRRGTVERIRVGDSRDVRWKIAPREPELVV